MCQIDDEKKFRQLAYNLFTMREKHENIIFIAKYFSRSFAPKNTNTNLYIKLEECKLVF